MLDLARPVLAARAFVLVCAFALLVSVPGAYASGEYELNDTRETASGPLAGGVDYTATFETENDVDWYLFYVRTYSQLEFSASTVSVVSPSCGGVAHLLLMDKDGKEIEGLFAASLNQVNHLYRTLSAGRYYLEVHNHGCPGNRYRFRIDPSTALTTSRECGEAIVTKDSVAPQVAKLQGELTKNGEALAKATGVLKTAKTALNRLKHRRHVSRYTKQRARRRVIAAEEGRGHVLEETVRLQTLGAQYGQTIAQADGQIAASC